jgi:Uncharacterized conserved protein (DUF2075)
MSSAVSNINDSAHAATNAFYGASVSEFVTQAPEAVVGILTTRASLEFRVNEREQTRAWQSQVLLLRAALDQVAGSESWGLVLEYSLRRLSVRPDAVLLASGVIIVLEFKMGAAEYRSEDARQVENYALCIRDFHAAARGFAIVPIVCAENAPSATLSEPEITDGVGAVMVTNGVGLAEALRAAASVVATGGAPSLTWRSFDVGGYSPTPTIVEAARAAYQGHSVAEIGRADADGAALQRAADRLRHWVLAARERRAHIACLLTGTPGSGKSLLGLNLVLAEGAGRVAGEPAVMLTGNRPLVHVLKRALATDAASRGDNTEARRALDGSLQTLLGYLKEHAPEEAPPPPESVVVFDEAQRAWDEETGQRLFQRRRSEPELFLEILHRLPWSCLVCLVGPGQEINRGEGGMRLWGAAFEREAAAGRFWRIVAASSESLSCSLHLELDTALHLTGAIRAYRNARYDQWVDALLTAQIDRAATLARSMANPPAFVTRSTKHLKEWLRHRLRGGRRPGLLVSSGAVRLVADQVPPPPMSNDLKAIENWFLKSLPDYRGSDSLELPLSEFGCQGLELDYVGLCWGGDLIWSPAISRWIPRRMSAPNWHVIRNSARAQFRLNAYRVLLTRSREGICIYVPLGDADDRTRSPSEFHAVVEALVGAGCVLLQ